MSVRFSAKETKNRTIMARLIIGTDVIAGIKGICKEHNVKAGAITTMLGSLNKITFVVLTPEPKNKCGVKYCEPIVMDGPIEVVCGAGTIGTMKDTGECAVHLHVMFADSKGNAYGGHLCEVGNPVAVTVEIVIEAFDDVTMERVLDAETEMPLFSIT